MEKSKSDRAGMDKDLRDGRCYYRYWNNDQRETRHWLPTSKAVIEQLQPVPQATPSPIFLITPPPLHIFPPTPLESPILKRLYELILDYHAGPPNEENLINNSEESNDTIDADNIVFDVIDDIEDGIVYENLSTMEFDHDVFAEAKDSCEVCAICFTYRSKIIFLPCNHLCLCLRCKAGLDIYNKARLRQNPCHQATFPMCNNIYTNAIEVYYS